MAIVPKSDSARIRKLEMQRRDALKVAEVSKEEIEKLLASSILAFIQKTQWAYLVTSATRVAVTPIDASALKQLKLFHTYIKRLGIFDYNACIWVRDDEGRENGMYAHIGEASIELEVASESSVATVDRIFRDEGLTSQIRSLEAQARQRIEAQREFSRLSHRRMP